MKPKLFNSCILLLIVAACQQIGSTARAAVAFSVTPSAVSNFYVGPITLQITALNAGETVQIDKFIDVNGNGVIDAADLAVQSFLLTDGQASVFYDGTTAVTNVSMPGDFNPTAGAVTAQLRIAGDITQRIVAQHLIRLSSPTSRFTPITIPFNVTNSAYAQSFTGTVRNNGTNVPNAVVMVAPGTGQGHGPIAGVMADSSGNYTLNLPGGSYMLWLFKSNYVANLSQAPVLTLTNGTTFTTNLHFLIPATTSVSGKVVDAANANTGLRSLFMICQTPDRQLMAGACYTGTNGAFTVPVTSGQWEVSLAGEGLAAYGYVNLQDRPRVDTTTGSVSGVTFALPKATALLYGTVLDSQSHPFAGFDIYCYDNNQQYETDGFTDANGYFVAAVVGGLSNDGWNAEVSDDNPPNGYIYSRPSFDQTGGVNVNVGKAVAANFAALLATNQISGNVTSAASQQPVANIGVYAYAPNINGINYSQYTVTDASGHYAFPAANGGWNVGLNCSGGDDSLATHGFQCVNEQSVNIVNANAVVNFSVQPVSSTPLQITTSDLPGGTVGAYYTGSLGLTGGQPPYSWWLPGGTMSLPPGQSGDMSFSSDGTIYGTPSTAGTYTFWVGVSDGAFPPNSVTQQVSLTISQPTGDVIDYFVVKLESFLQLSPTTPVPNTTNGPFIAYLGLVQSAIGSVPVANVTLPGGSQRALPAGSSGIRLQTQEAFANQGLIDSTYQPGNYTFNLYAVHDGARSPILAMPAAAFPNPPRVSNFALAQTINPSAPFTLQWDFMSGATTNDSFWLLITDAGGMVFSTPDPATDHVGALPGTATSVVLPASTLQAGHAYTGWLTYFRPTSINESSYPGAAGVTMIATMTTFPLALNSGAPRLDLATRLSGTQYRFQLSGTTNQTYTVQVATNLPPTSWFTLTTTNLSVSPVLIQDNQATNKQRFYRVKVGL